MPTKPTISPEDKLNQQRLTAWIKKLKADDVIKYDNELAERLDYTTATISQYKSGSKPVSFSFIKTFEEKYQVKFAQIKLNDAGKTRTPKMPEDKTMKLLKLMAKKMGISDKLIEEACR